MILLNQDTLDTVLLSLGSNWSKTDNLRILEFKHSGLPYRSYAEIAYNISEQAEALNHHPLIVYGYNNEGKPYLHLELSTHSAGGITQKDVNLAIAINNIFDTVFSITN